LLTRGRSYAEASDYQDFSEFVRRRGQLESLRRRISALAQRGIPPVWGIVKKGRTIVG